MQAIPFYMSVNYQTPKSCGEQALSILSNYFYLGGRQATVFKEDEVKLENGKSSCGVIALKITSYLLLFPLTIPLFAIYSVLRYQHDFTLHNSIEDQRRAHDTAKKNLIEKAGSIGAEVTFVTPLIEAIIGPSINSVKINKDLDGNIFSWQKTDGVQDDIQKDGKLSDRVVLYGVASQFNSCEASDRFTPGIGKAVETYKNDRTQGPLAQLQFPDQQVELINIAANEGLNGLCRILDEETKSTVKHGYLTPETKESAESLIQALTLVGHQIEFLCIGNIPKGEGNTQKVYEMLVAAPAFGRYDFKNSTVTDSQKREIEFLCAFWGYRAQFYQVCQIARSNLEKQVIFKPTTPGLGVFGNKVESVAKAFYFAAKEFEWLLKLRNIKVQLQVFKGQGEAKNMADMLGLEQCSDYNSKDF